MPEETELQQANRARHESAWQALSDCCFGSEVHWGKISIVSLLALIPCVFIYAYTDYKNQSAAVGGVALFLSLLSFCIYRWDKPSPTVTPLNAVLVRDSAEEGGGDQVGVGALKVQMKAAG